MVLGKTEIPEYGYSEFTIQDQHLQKKKHP